MFGNPRADQLGEKWRIFLLSKVFCFEKNIQQIHVTDLTAHSPILPLSKAWPSNPTTLRPERQAPIHTHGGEGTGEDTHARVPGQTLVLKAAPKTPEAESGSHFGIHQPKGQGLVTHNGLKHQIHGMKK